MLATGLSASRLASASKAAAEAGLANVETLVADAQELDLELESFDAAICRAGVTTAEDIGWARPASGSSTRLTE